MFSTNDLLCEPHRQEILRGLLWPDSLELWLDSACAGCRTVAVEQPTGTYYFFPAEMQGRLHRWSAYHEAGHVVVNLAVGHRVLSAEQEEGESGQVKFRSASPPDLFAEATSAWAGLLAQRAVILDDGLLDEVTVVGTAAASHGDAKAIVANTGGPDEIRAALLRAEALVAGRWDDIERVAEALLQRERLDEHEILELVFRTPVNV